MKHGLYVTLWLVMFFVIAQLVGVLVVSKYLAVEELPYGIERPEIEEETSYIPIAIAIIIATGLALLIMKLGVLKLWKAWFFLGAVITMLIAFGAFVSQSIALVLAAVLAVFKVFKPNVYVHNFTELFIYSGIAGLFVPLMGLLAIFILLILISIYDMVAVWKTKHMISLAKFQSKAKVFAGLMIPYDKGKKTAILGGGDIGFPMLFVGVVLKSTGVLDAFLVILFAAIALLLLFFYSKKNKFYPAMPYLTVGCFAGYLVGLLI